MTGLMSVDWADLAARFRALAAAVVVVVVVVAVVAGVRFAGARRLRSHRQDPPT